MSEWYKVGKIVNTHGVRGEIRVISSTDFAEERYAVGTELMIRHEGKKEEVKVVVRHHRKHKNFDLLQFENYHSINEVELFKGATLYVSEEELSELGEGEFYYHEIIGCSVVTEQDEELGKVKEIIETGANDVWVIQRSGPGKDILIPYIEECVKEIDVEQKLVRIHLMEGLIE
ncbi:ribosome maturation factor RimM [Halalkalibacter akibai]|uniref:Ribosome maturation factor RimM n=1 Tax=Halalkalibacter akibai (strain ATCC 43226 / DSM 21942 / CIP 109018 / JCM 9157 / 1139) TaxID=1236973 RepID=W4QRJ7_HALA3|nr:ribosome maturation factor RimM [Halalkalibacter akibai]GAE33929.1 16S rRNA processing protein RimM [Halalkalibacter akibai JCM 9157]